jgi:hypothetical protein
MNQRGALILYILLAITFISIALAFYFGGLYFRNQPKTQPNEVTVTVQSPEPQYPNCPKQGLASKSDYLPTYTVKKGDTLLLIAKNQLNDVSRVSELIQLNKEEFPTLSIENPFLEQGWKLFIPPPYTQKTNGQIFNLNGNLMRKDSIWGVGWARGGGGSFKPEELQNLSDLPDGTCISVIYQGGPIEDHKVLSVTKQNP